MSHLFTVKAVSKTAGLSTLTTLNYCKHPSVLHGPGGGFRVEFLDANATDDVRQIIIVGDYTGQPDGEHGPDEEFYSNVRRAERLYIENEKGATVQSLHTNIAHVPYFPEADLAKNKEIRAAEKKSRTVLTPKKR